MTLILGAKKQKRKTEGLLQEARRKMDAMQGEILNLKNEKQEMEEEYLKVDRHRRIFQYLKV